MKPTRDELLQALQALIVDTYGTYKALESGRPVISIGQWGRLQRAQDLVGREADSVGDGGSVACPHCHWGFAPSVIKQHIREKH